MRGTGLKYSFAAPIKDQIPLLKRARVGLPLIKQQARFSLPDKLGVQIKLPVAFTTKSEPPPPYPPEHVEPQEGTDITT